jgi:hypothetical protein
MKIVFIYVNTSKRFGDPDHLKVFAYVDAAETWFEKNDSEGVAFEYEVLEWIASGTARSFMLMIVVLAPIWNVLGRLRWGAQQIDLTNPTETHRGRGQLECWCWER